MSSLDADFRTVRGDFELSVSAQFPQGQTTAIIGPNGAGKSTLLQTVAGFVRLTQGRLAYGAQVWAQGDQTHVPPYLRSAVLLAQSAALFPHMTVSQNILFGPKSRKLTNQQEILDKWVAELELDGLQARRPRQLSGGQQQRVALARAFASAPDVLLLDEPTSALDVSGANQFRTTLRRQLNQRPMTALLVTHSPADVLALADSVLVLQNGAVTYHGSTRELWRSPTRGFAATFTGVNTLQGVFLNRVDRIGTVQISPGLILRGVLSGPLTESVSISIPPTKVRITPTQTTDSDNTWKSRVLSVNSFEEGFALHLENPTDLVAHLAPEDFWKMDLSPGDMVTVRIDPEDAILS